MRSQFTLSLQVFILASQILESCSENKSHSGKKSFFSFCFFLGREGSSGFHRSGTFLLGLRALLYVFFSYSAHSSFQLEGEHAAEIAEGGKYCWLHDSLASAAFHQRSVHVPVQKFYKRSINFILHREQVFSLFDTPNCLNAPSLFMLKVSNCLNDGTQLYEYYSRSFKMSYITDSVINEKETGMNRDPDAGKPEKYSLRK